MLVRPSLPQLSARSLGLARRFVKFGVVGASGVALNATVFWLLAGRLHLHYLAAGFISFEAALYGNFLLNRRWTFADRRTAPAGPARYQTVALGGLAINLLALHLLVAGVGVRPALANLAGIAAATGWNFTLNLRWTWREVAA